MAGTRKRTALVLYNSILAGRLTKAGSMYQFTYEQDYLQRPGSRPVSLTLPLQVEAYESEALFPAFINMLSEGANKRMQCRLLKIDENDYFGLLLATAKNDSIGPITIQEDHGLS
jgi:HipA-like protein